MQRFRAPMTRFFILLPPSPAIRLVWVVGCALLLFAANAYAGQASLAWDAVSASNLGGYRLYYRQTFHTCAVGRAAGSTCCPRLKWPKLSL